MKLPPLEVIASWPTPNYDDPVTRGPAPIIFNLILFPLVCFFMALRMFTRLRISKSFGRDDWLIFAALFPTCAFATISLVVQFRYQWNRHIWDIVPSTIPLGLKLILSSMIIFDAATNLTKLSMLTLTYRIIGDGSRTLRKVTIGVMIVVAVQGTIFIFTVLFQCRPPSQYWTLSLEPQTCISESAMLLSAGIINTITDFLVVVLPVPVVWKLKLGGKEQVVLMLLFGTGFIVSIVGGIRTAYTYKVTVSNDRPWDIFPVWITGSVELYVGIICACIPATKKFFSYYMPRLIGPSEHSRTPISMEAKLTHGSSSTKVEDVELGATWHETSPLPLEGKDTTSGDVQDVSAPHSKFSGFDFGLERTDSQRSSRTAEVDELYEVLTVEVYDYLVTSTNSSHAPHEAYG